MRIPRITLLLFALLQVLFVSGRQQRDSVLNRIISVDAENIPVFMVLEQISLENLLFFSYDATLINTDRKITLHASNLPVVEVLNKIFSNDEFRYIGKSNHIIISAGEYSDQPPLPPEEAEVPSMLVIRGRVVDNTIRYPLSAVSVSLQDRPIGTITNSNGEFILKLPPEVAGDTIVFSHLGYARRKKVAGSITEEETIGLQPVSIRIKEVRVKAVSPEEILENFRKQIPVNYSDENKLITSFYRETVRQDDEYISVSEAVMEILKAPYGATFRDDKVHLLKARHSPEVNPFHWVNFKFQGGAYTITLLDVVKKMETFIDREYEQFYRYNITDVIRYKNYPVYVVRFRPVKFIDFPCFIGEMYIDRNSFALLYARFSLDNFGLEIAGETMIRKKPKGFKVKPQFVDYQVDFSELDGKWYLHTAKASVSFRVKSPHDRINAVYHIVSDLLVTDVRDTDLKRFPAKSLFTIHDIFSEMAVEYDEKFWEDYNIIKPDEDLENAIKKFKPFGKPVKAE